jgi:hypothetical protein
MVPFAQFTDLVLFLAPHFARCSFKLQTAPPSHIIPAPLPKRTFAGMETASDTAISTTTTENIDTVRYHLSASTVVEVPRRCMYPRSEVLQLLDTTYTLARAEGHSAGMEAGQKVAEEEKKKIEDEWFKKGLRLIVELFPEGTISHIVCSVIDCIAPPPLPAEPPELILPTNYDDITDYIISSTGAKYFWENSKNTPPDL